MAATRFAYVRSYEMLDAVLPNTYMVVRLDGRGFHRFSDVHKFEKPNDEKALELMDKSARMVMEEYGDISMAFGESDEYSFLFKRKSGLYNRRQRSKSKILTSVTSLFTSSYVYNWSTYFPKTKLEYPPMFDGRLVVYPGEREVKDYFAWRQADTHINNLFNTTFWALVMKGGMTNGEAYERLKGTVSGDKNEILFSQFGINYSKLPERFKKGSVLVREEIAPEVPIPRENLETLGSTGSNVEDGDLGGGDVAERRRLRKEMKALKKRGKETRVKTLHCDVIGAEFWDGHPDVLE